MPPPARGGPPWGGPPPYARPRGGGMFLRAVIATLLVVVLLDLVGINLIVLASIGAASAQPRVKEVTVEDGSTDQSIVAIPVDEIITDDTAHQFDEFLTAAEQDKTVKAIVLEIDTPGGSASASDAMHHRLELFKDHMKNSGRDVPVIVSMGGMATSGGYYVACGGDYIFAEPATMTANIGVLLPRFNVYELLKKYGVEETTIVGSGGDYKNLGSMFQPEDPKAREYLQGLVDATLEQFKKVVLEGRQGKLPKDTSGIFNGRVYMADDALKLGLIDEIGYHEDAYAFAKSKSHADGAQVVRYQPPPLLQRLLNVDSLANIGGGQARSTSQTINFNGIGLDQRSLGELLAPRPMYLWMGN